MLSEKEKEMTIARVMISYYLETGKLGWTRKDIVEEVANAGGDSDDVLDVIRMGIEICDNRRRIPMYIMN